jgi:hypothetical protein
LSKAPIVQRQLTSESSGLLFQRKSIEAGLLEFHGPLFDNCGHLIVIICRLKPSGHFLKPLQERIAINADITSTC